MAPRKLSWLTEGRASGWLCKQNGAKHVLHPIRPRQRTKQFVRLRKMRFVKFPALFATIGRERAPALREKYPCFRQKLDSTRRDAFGVANSTFGKRHSR